MLSLQHQLLFARSGSMTFVGSSSWIWWKCLRRDSGRSTNQPLGEGFSSMFFCRSDCFPLALSIYLLLIIFSLDFCSCLLKSCWYLIGWNLQSATLVPHFLPDKYRRGLVLQDDSKGEGLLPSRKLTELLMRAQKGQRILMGSLLPTKAWNHVLEFWKKVFKFVTNRHIFFHRYRCSPSTKLGWKGVHFWDPPAIRPPLIAIQPCRPRTRSRYNYLHMIIYIYICDYIYILYTWLYIYIIYTWLYIYIYIYLYMIIYIYMIIYYI